MSTFRPAEINEDERLSIILCNAFLTLWNHNWFHGIAKPLKPIEYSTGLADNSLDYTITKPLTSHQSSRRQFYLSLIKLTRLHGGDIHVNLIRSDEHNGHDDYGAILLWLPPGKQGGSIFTELPLLYQSGFLNLTLPWKYGPGAFHRTDSVYETNVREMFDATLKPRGFNPRECGFVQMLAANPVYAGKGYASKLLAWRIAKHFEEFPTVPVILDTSTEQGVRTYERMGFDLLDERNVDTGTDALGIKLAKGVDESVREEGRRTCVQRVMLRMPPA
ncbi:hypothetical protein EJ08DRAFT_655677 [Tothia fuscella]|uniref:N-acetyltransferase domain-containing protein n=1 Tax=Tothia fuscella TaxID=1048955 RepID=A0A9P4P2Z6_9PEZI|nr:hypothetical protein EJ08DRAFT_655677 [Tothia fuscella]